LADVVTRRKRLLEWNPSSEVDRELSRFDRNSLAASFRTMWVGPLMAVGLALYLSAFAPTALVVAGPILLLWFASPAMAWWISLPLARREAR
jgi:cyclic beta-1,2-glucan synthetase